MHANAGTLREVVVASLCFASLAVAANASAGPPPSKPIIVADVVALQNALADAGEGDRILVRPGSYRVATTVAVPDGVSLEGAGVMLGSGLPTGFRSGSEARILALSELNGDVVTLGNGASLRGLVVEDVGGRSGNAIAVGSRWPADSVTASIVECEIVNPNRASGTADGPTGAVVAVLTRNPAAADPPGPHVSAVVALSMRRSIVRATGGGRALFAINSAPQGRLDIQLAENLVAGALDVVGGVSRGDEVTEAAITIDSRANLYAPTTVSPSAWSIIGGSSLPFSDFGTFGASSNQVRVDSTDDRIEGVPTAIAAFGGRRLGLVFGLSSNNSVELDLRGLTLKTLEAGGAGADFQLAAAASFAQGSGGEFPAGNDNTLTVLVRDATGSGPRANLYEDVFGPLLPQNFGSGNRLEFVGTAAAFEESNRDIEPAPPETFFTD